MITSPSESERATESHQYHAGSLSRRVLELYPFLWDMMWNIVKLDGKVESCPSGLEFKKITLRQAHGMWEDNKAQKKKDIALDKSHSRLVMG